MNSEQAAEIMSTRDAATSLGVSVRTVQLWVENGCLQAWKTPGGHRRIYRQSVNTMLAARYPQADHVSRFEVLICAHAASDAAPLVALLKSLGTRLHVRAVTTGDEALTLLGERCPDLLIIDLVDANISSMQMLQALCSRPLRRPMQIIIVTDLGDKVLENLGSLYPGITKFIKPLATAQLQQLVRLYMEISRN